jgi:ubiquinone/menaquinone biosynthesis C-methylase UbiE
MMQSVRERLPLAAFPALALDDVAYRLQQAAWLVPSRLAQLAILQLSGERRRVDVRAERAVIERYETLLSEDLANVNAGYYSRALLFDMPYREYAKQAPRLVLEIARTMKRRREGAWREIPDTATRDDFPAYYRRTFHWQTDGYFSDRSAQVYDLSVEFLFGGVADVMRRQNIPPIVRHVRACGMSSPRILDVACGTGRTLCQLASALPTAQLTGVDLSPAYVNVARTSAAAKSGAVFTQANAERLPFADASFDVVTSTYLFHELPRRVRRDVMAEMFRVLAPGGIVVIQDSAQRSESPEIAPLLEQFPRDYHEPFYADYLGDDLAEALAENGFTDAKTSKTFVAKVVTARK